MGLQTVGYDWVTVQKHFLGVLGKPGFIGFTVVGEKSFLNWVPSLLTFIFFLSVNANKSSCWHFGSFKMWWVWGIICGCYSFLGPQVVCLQCPGDEQVHLHLLRRGLIKWPWQWTSVNACEVTRPREKNLPVFLTSSSFCSTTFPAGCVWLPASFLLWHTF